MICLSVLECFDGWKSKQTFWNVENTFRSDSSYVCTFSSYKHSLAVSQDSEYFFLCEFSFFEEPVSLQTYMLKL